ncbi:MAG: transposase [Eubacterium sp.]
MRYSYEFKRKCVEMYRDGVYTETPDGIKTENFRKTVREWFRIEEACGPEALKHKSHNKEWTVEERYELVDKTIAGESMSSVAISAGIDPGMLCAWMHKYEESEYEELIRLRAENERLRTENAVIKKEIVLK